MPPRPAAITVTAGDNSFGPGNPLWWAYVESHFSPAAFPPMVYRSGPLPLPPTQPQKRVCSVGNTSASFGQYLRGVGSAATMFGEFASGLGPDNLTFGPGSVQSQMMSSSPGIAQAINAYSNGDPTGTYIFGLGGLWAAGANPIQQFVGSYAYRVSPTAGGLNITLSNYTSVHSGSYHLLPSHQRSTFGPMGTTHQTYQVFVPCHN